MSSDIRKKLEKLFNKIDKLAQKGKDKIYEYHQLVDEFIERGDFDNFTQTLYYYYDIDVSIYQGNIPDLKKKTWSEILFQTNTPFQKKLKRLYDSKVVYQQGFDVYSDAVVTLGFNISSPLSTTYSVTSSTQSITPYRVDDKIYFDVNHNFATSSIPVYTMELFKCEWLTIDGVEQPYPKTLELFQRFKVLATQSTYLTEMSIYHGRQYLVKTFARNSNMQFTELNYKLDVTRNSLLGQIIEIDSYTDDPAYYQKDKGLAKFQGLRKTYLEVTKTGTASVYVTYENPAFTEDQNLLKRYEAAITYLIS